MQLKGGELLEFGELPNSGSLGIEHAFGNKNAVLRWRLVRHSDAIHRLAGEPVNYVDYRWKRLGKRGLLYLTDIYDTPRANGPRGDADFAHHTQLTWQSPDFPQTFYADPYRATPDLRLSRVAVASMPWSGTGPREVIRTYILGYAAAQGATTTVALSQVFQLWHHSFLSEIRMVGRCSQVEDDQGNINIPPILIYIPLCERLSLPPTTFEYEDGHPGFGIARMTKVQGGAPNAVDENRVLPYLNSVGVVDFNRDGLPDIVQSWNSEICRSHDPETGELLEPGPHVEVGFNQDYLECHNASRGRGGSPFQSSRPITGYLNLGLEIKKVHLAYQCMDAGTVYDITGLTHYNISSAPGFFTNGGGSTLVGSWGQGVLAWSKAQYAPYRAKPLQPVRNTQQAASKPSEFEPGTGCDADHFKESDFDPGWKWEKTQSGDWAKPAVTDPVSQPGPTGGHGPFFRAPRWFTDIDGDGLIDRLVDTGIRAFDFNVANVEFTRRYGKNDPRPDAAGCWPGSPTRCEPVQIPFAFDPSAFTGESLAPSFEAEMAYNDLCKKIPFRPIGEKCALGTKFYYVDINGDGLVDLVTQNLNDSGGIPRVRPGDGHGHFWCDNSQQPWPCQEWPTEPSSGYEIVSTGSNLPWPGSRMPWPFTDETFFHDVTGDGLADIVQYDMSSGKVRVWVNQDGHTFACATSDCVAGKVLNALTESHGLSGGAEFNIGEHRTTFADMNADGIDDIVILAKQGAYVGTFMTKDVVVMDFERGGAPRPGLLTRIHNGYGATTDIRYRTIQELDLEVKDTAYAWRTHSPVAQSVVTQIVTQDSYHAGGNLNDTQISAPYQFKRKAEYVYQNPAYDRWSRSFAGFRKVVAHYGDERATTATTYWFGPCQNNELDARPPGARATPLCPEGSDDDYYKSLTGRVVRIDRGNELLDIFPNSWLYKRAHGGEGPKLLWTKTFQYSLNSSLFDPPDRRVSFSYPSQIDTYLYDDTQPTKPGYHFR